MDTTIPPTVSPRPVTATPRRPWTPGADAPPRRGRRPAGRFPLPAGRFLLLACLLSACAGREGGPDVPGEGPVVDHHVHLLGPQLVADWKALGVPFSRPDSMYVSATAVLGDRPDRAAFLVSMAHIYGSTDFRDGLALSPEQEYRKVRHANDHVARQVVRHPGRLVGFCSVHLGRPYARREIERCRADPGMGGAGMAGLKIHLPASGMSLGDARSLDALREIARESEAAGVALLMHLTSAGESITREQVDRFIREVVRPHPDLELYLAHMGGGGGYRSPARNVVEGFTDFLARDPEQRHVFFELSGAILYEETDGVPPSSVEEVEALARDLRRLGLDRVVLGTDYPVFDRHVMPEAVRHRLGFTPGEAARVLSNVGPALAPRPTERASAHDPAGSPRTTAAPSTDSPPFSRADSPT